MKALMIHGKDDIRLDEVPTPEPTGDQVRVKMAFGGICGSDLHYYFEGKNGEMIAGSCPVRFFGEDADVLDEGWGERPAGCSFGLALNQGATASVYRAEDGAIMFLVLGTKDVAQCGWVRGAKAPKPKSF